MRSSRESLYTQIFTDYPDVVTVTDLCEMLKICRRTAYKMLHDQQIDSFRIGRDYKIPKIYVLDYIAGKH